MSSTFNRAAEYECQFYGFSSHSAQKGIETVLDEVIQSILESAERKINFSFNYPKENVTKSVKSLLEEYKKSAKNHTWEIKDLVQTYFAIPKDVLLPGDEIQKLQYTNDVEEEIDFHLKEAMSKLRMLLMVEEKIRNTLDTTSNLPQIAHEVNEVKERMEIYNKKLDESDINQSDICSLIKDFQKLNNQNMNS